MINIKKLFMFEYKKHIKTLVYYSLISSVLFNASILFGQQPNTSTRTSSSMSYNQMRVTHILGSSSRLCTGVSIGERAILTTADCVLGNDIPVLIKPDIGFRNYNKILPRKVYIHPLYDGNKNKFQYNLAVLVYSETAAKAMKDDTSIPALIPVSFDMVKLFQNSLFLDPYSSSNTKDILKDPRTSLNVNTYSIDQKNYDNPDFYFNYNKVTINTNIAPIYPIEYDTNTESFDKSESVSNSSMLVRSISCGIQADNSLTNCTDQPMNSKINQGSGLFYNDELIATYSGSTYTIQENDNGHPYLSTRIVNIKEYWNTITNTDTYKFIKEIVPNVYIESLNNL